MPDMLTFVSKEVGKAFINETMLQAAVVVDGVVL